MTLLLLTAPAILACEAVYGVPPDLVVGMIRVESQGDTLARAGSHRGLMQLSSRYTALPRWALHVPAIGIVEGCRHLAEMEQWCRTGRARSVPWRTVGANVLRGVPGVGARSGPLSGDRTWCCALRGYRWGSAGVRGERGQQYLEEVTR